MNKISVIIPTYKKVHQLIENLEINLHWLHSEEVIVVNDYPNESIASVMQRFPHVILIENKRNLGFSGAVNAGINRASGTHILLLNSDVVLKDETFRNGLKHFKDETVFAVSFAQLEKDNTIVGRNRFFWHDGFFQHESIAAGNDVVMNGWAEGGSSLFDANKLRELGCFDTRYSPFYWEDIDLSYRAWKQGYSILFDPSIQVEHHHESTISSYFSSQTITRIAYRNQLLFIYKNIHDNKLRKSMFLPVLKMIIRTVLKGDLSFLVAFLSTMKYSIGKGNQPENTHFSDSEVLSRFN